jgi:hypothetical protein
MCRRVECAECEKPTFAGCGMHVEQVLGDVPKAERCTCHERGSSAKTTEKTGSAEASILRRFFGA